MKLNVPVKQGLAQILISYFVTRSGRQRRGDEMISVVPMLLFPGLQPLIQLWLINHWGCHSDILILAFFLHSSIQMLLRTVVVLNPMFRPPNELHGEYFSSLILPLISPANVCVSQSEPGQILKIRKILKKSPKIVCDKDVFMSEFWPWWAPACFWGGGGFQFLNDEKWML